MSDLRELYQEVILDHNRSPKNRRVIAEADRAANGHNPLCGDQITVYVSFDGDRIADVSFEGSGCAISTASASLMTEALKGKTLAEVETVFRAFHEMVTGEPGAPIDQEKLGKLKVFQGVCEFPIRVKCATLAWHTLNAALDNEEKTVTTE